MNLNDVLALMFSTERALRPASCFIGLTPIRSSYCLKPPSLQNPEPAFAVFSGFFAQSLASLWI